MPRRIFTAREQFYLGAGSPFHDPAGRYQGPMKSNTSYPPDPYGGSDHCPECGSHFLDPHVGHEPPHSKWGSQHQAIPTHPDAQFGADVKRHIDQNGGWGLTMRDHPGDAPTSGFMVSHPGEREESRSRLDPHSIRRYVQDKAPLINSHPDNYYGGWEAPRTEESGKGGQPGWYHDVSRNVQEPRDAAEMALKNNQQAVYDLDKNEEVSTPDMVNRATSPGIGLFSRRRQWLTDGSK